MFAAVILFSIVRSLIGRKRDPVGDVRFDQLPPVLQEEIQRIAPDFQPESIRATESGSDAYLRGDYRGTRASIEADFDAEGNLVEFEFEAVHGSRTRRGIAQGDLPAAVVAEVDRVLGDERARFTQQGQTAGTLNGEGNYKVRGDADDWSWEIEVSESGQLLEVEKEKRRR
jgi:hypothetical protein